MSARRRAAVLVPLLCAAVAVPGLWAAPAHGADGGWPLPSPTVVADFDPPAEDWLAGHRGVDLAAWVGQPVRAMVGGTVVFSGLVAGKPVVVVRLPDGRRLTYEPVRGRVVVGQPVAAGTVIGTVAAAGGHCPSTCLHVGLRTSTGYDDPLSLIVTRPAVLKPL